MPNSPEELKMTSKHEWYCNESIGLPCDLDCLCWCHDPDHRPRPASSKMTKDEMERLKALAQEAKPGHKREYLRVANPTEILAILARVEDLEIEQGKAIMLLHMAEPPIGPLDAILHWINRRSAWLTRNAPPTTKEGAR